MLYPSHIPISSRVMQGSLIKKRLETARLWDILHFCKCCNTHCDSLYCKSIPWAAMCTQYYSKVQEKVSVSNLYRVSNFQVRKKENIQIMIYKITWGKLHLISHLVLLNEIFNYYFKDLQGTDRTEMCFA